MASLWTPEGEHRVQNDQPGASAPAASPSSDVDADFGKEAFGADYAEQDEEQVRAEIAAMERDLLSAPVEAIVANHCYGFFQLAAMHLSQSPPHLFEAAIAIDALSAVVERLDERLGDTAATLNEALAQIRLAYVQISAAHSGAETTNGAGEQSGPEAE